MNRIERRGPRFTIECLVLQDGSCPAGEFLDGLGRSDRRKMDALIDLYATRGEIRNPERFKYIEGSAKIYEFKSYQIRMPCFHAPGRRLIIAFGIFKKSDKWKPAEVRRAEQYREWFFSQEGEDG